MNKKTIKYLIIFSIIILIGGAIVFAQNNNLPSSLTTNSTLIEEAKKSKEKAIISDDLFAFVREEKEGKYTFQSIIVFKDNKQIIIEKKEIVTVDDCMNDTPEQLLYYDHHYDSLCEGEGYFYGFSNLEFSPDNNFLIFHEGFWEASSMIIYDLLKEKEVNRPNLVYANRYGFTEDGKYFYALSMPDGMWGSPVYFKIYTVPDFVLKEDLFNKISYLDPNYCKLNNNILECFDHSPLKNNYILNNDTFQSTCLFNYNFDTEKLEIINNNLPSSGLTPDSPLYFLKTWQEKIKLIFTFGEENKTKEYLRLSGVRLAEYQKMIEKGKTEIAQKPLDKYESQLKKLEEIYNKSLGENNIKIPKLIIEKLSEQRYEWANFSYANQGKEEKFYSKINEIYNLYLLQSPDIRLSGCFFSSEWCDLKQKCFIRKNESCSTTTNY